MASNSSGRMEVPEAKEAMDRFKMEVADELGVPLKNGYNGNLTSAQNGSVGGEMVRQMIKRQEEQMSGKTSENQSDPKEKGCGRMPQPFSVFTLCFSYAKMVTVWVTVRNWEQFPV